MKKTLIFVVTLGLFAGFAGFSSNAMADYSVSIGYNTGRQYSGRTYGDRTYGGRNTYYPHADRHYTRARYNRHSYPFYYPFYFPIVLQRTVTYEQERQTSDNRERFGISDVIVLSKAGVSDDIIIEKIRTTGSVFNLSVEEVEALRREGVSSRVVNYMLNTNG